MTPKDVIKNTIDTCHGVLTAYISDLNDADLMVRAVPEANHLAWQLGHLIASEHQMLTDGGHRMPDMPAGFAESYTKETAASDDQALGLQAAAGVTIMRSAKTPTLEVKSAASFFEKRSTEECPGIALILYGIGTGMSAIPSIPTV